MGELLRFYFEKKTSTFPYARKYFEVFKSNTAKFKVWIPVVAKFFSSKCNYFPPGDSYNRLKLKSAIKLAFRYNYTIIYKHMTVLCTEKWLYLISVSSWLLKPRIVWVFLTLCDCEWGGELAPSAGQQVSLQCRSGSNVRKDQISANTKATFQLNWSDLTAVMRQKWSRHRLSRDHRDSASKQSELLSAWAF